MRLEGAAAAAFTQSLRKVIVNDDRWEILYWHQPSHELWLMSYPNAAHHGGGAPQIDLMEDGDALAATLKDRGWVAEDPNVITELLVDRWCERRALRPLRHILEAWPNLGLTDGYGALRDALANVRSLARDDLDGAEAELAHLAQNGVERALRSK